jgi:cobalt-zinc-cadmium efflux system outer membrane protein
MIVDDDKLVDGDGARPSRTSQSMDSVVPLAVVAAIVAALGSACASPSAAPAFRDTASLVEARTGRRISWNQGAAADEAGARRIRELVGHDLSVDGAVEIALLNNERLQAIYEDLSIAQADLVQAGLLQNPSLSGGVTVPVAGPGVQTGFDVGVVQNVLALLTMSARKKIASTELEATILRVADDVLRTSFEVQTAYYTLVAAQQSADVRRTARDAGDAAMALAEAQHAAGNISDLDLVNQRSLSERFRTDVLRREADVLTARDALTRLLGLWGSDAAFRVPPHLPDPARSDPPIDRLEALAVAQRLDLAAAHERTQALVHAVALATDFRFVGSPTVAATFERSPERYSAITPSASLELPIFDQKQAVVARLEAQVRQARAHENALAVDVRSEVRAAGGRLVAMRAVVERYARIVVPLREEAVRLSEEQYDGMVLGPYLLLAAKQSEVDAHGEFIEALRDYWIARADLERAVGSSLPNGPSAPLPAGATP